MATALHRTGQGSGFTLAEIGTVLGPDRGGSPEGVLAAARAKLAAVDEQIEELARVRCRLHQLAELCRHGDDADCVALRIVS